MPAMGVGSMLRMARKRTEELPVLEMEDARMGSSPRLTRRRLFTAAAAVAALRFQSARAQTTTDSGCTIGFVNGLLQYSPDCPLLTPPGLGMAVAPPSHLIALAQAADGATGEISGDTVPQSGGRRQRRNARQAQRRKFARSRRHRRVKRNRASRHRRQKRRQG